MRSFASDNNSGIHPSVMEALAKANNDHALGYGDDGWTREAERAVRKEFTPDSLPLFAFNGTGANTVALQLVARPYQSILCAETAHIYVDECGAPVKATGCQIRPIETPDGKLTPERIEPFLTGFGDQHHSQPGVIYLSECTELGTIYSPQELRAVTALAHEHGLRVYMDGARIANAAAALDVSLRELTADCGIDLLTFGGTKNGLLNAECIVVLDPSLAREALYIRKQSAQLASKMRFLSCQYTAYLKEGLWLSNARQANAMARLLYTQLSNFPEIRFSHPVESNQLFLTMPRKAADRLLESYFLYFWNESAGELRIVTSFDTTEEDVATFTEIVKEALEAAR